MYSMPNINQNPNPMNTQKNSLSSLIQIARGEGMSNERLPPSQSQSMNDLNNRIRSTVNYSKQAYRM